MDTYLALLYVTLEQELALKDFFIDRGWTYCKPDLGVMTDRVGPYESPQTLVTNTGNIITYYQQSGNTNRPVKTKLKRGIKRAAVSQEDPEVKIEVLHEEEDLSRQLFDTSSTENTVDKQNENYYDDDDFADDLETSVEDKENDQSITERTDSASKRGRKPVGKNAEHTPDEKGEASDETTAVGSNITDMVKTRATARKKRKVAADGGDKTEAVTADKQHGQATWTPVVVMKDIIEQLTKPPRKKALITKFKCSMCPKEYKLQFQLDRHSKREHEVEKVPKEKTPKKKPQCRQCDICGSVFSRSDILLDHKRRIHLGIRKVKTQQVSTCETCGLSFKRRTHLNEHTLRKHSNSPLPHACNVCEKSFLRHRNLELHINRDHLNVKPFACSFCGKQFFAQHSANNHIKEKVCKPDRERNFKCMKCEKTFPKAGSLEMHMTAVHFGGAFSCVCGEVVKWEGSVAKHKRRCQTYQDYVAVHGEDENKLRNIIEVPYNDEVSVNTADSPTADNDPSNAYSIEVVIDNAETEETVVEHESSQADIETSYSETVD